MGVRTWLTVMALGAGLGLGGVARGASFMPFMPEQFMADQDSKRPTLIEVFAPWSPICVRQQPILDELENDPRYADISVLRVDFDSQKSVLRKLRVTAPSTLIGFHGTGEVGRLVGTDDQRDIEALLASTLRR